MICMPYWSFPTRKTEINIKSPHLSTHYHTHVQCHTEPNMQTLYVEVIFTADKCSLSARVFCNTQQDTFFNFIYINFSQSSNDCSASQLNTEPQGKGEHIQHEFYTACFAITKQLQSEALVFYKHVTEMIAQRSTIVAGCWNNTGCIDPVRSNGLTVANYRRP